MNRPSLLISRRSVETFQRYGRFSIFQDGGRRHLWFWKFQIFNVVFCRLWQQSRLLLRQSRTLLRHCCWCGRGLRCSLLLQTEYRGLSVCRSVRLASEPCKNGWIDRDAVWKLTRVGPTNHVCIRYGSRSLHWKRQFWGIVQPIKKHWESLVLRTQQKVGYHSILNNSTTYDVATLFDQILRPLMLLIRKLSR